MSCHEGERYIGREQSLIKHIILEKYLERFAVIVGHGFDGIVYIDGFSGPWNVRSENMDDASFGIALHQLRKARDTVRTAFRRELRIKCIFLERASEPYARLEAFAREQPDVEITTLNQEFECAIPQLLRLIAAAGRGYFPFVFVDPTGWKGFALQTMAPLLRIEPCEVLVNFMTGFILRFAEDSREGIDSSFQELFGDSSFRVHLTGLAGQDREDALVFEYARRLGEVGNFPLVPVTVIPHPTKDRTHFHLVYATRSTRGLEVFKGVERKALGMLGTIRADAKRREREARTKQTEMFPGTEVPDTDYVQHLADHYAAKARDAVRQAIYSRQDLSFDEVCAVGLRFPTVQLDAVRQWTHEIASIPNLAKGERVAKLGAQHKVKLRPSFRAVADQ